MVRPLEVTCKDEKKQIFQMAIVIGDQQVKNQPAEQLTAW
jgi:hypothetical protein